MLLEEKDILKRLITNESLFNYIHVVTQKYDILPDDKEHIGTYIEYQDIQELREDFLEELGDSIIDWIYSSSKYEYLKKEAMSKGKSDSAASQEIGRKAKRKFRGNRDSDQLLIQGQLGELLLYHFIQHCMKAVPLLRKMPIMTSSEHERFGADAIHYKVENDKNIIILGEAKTYTSKYRFNQAFEDALNSILDTYTHYRDELKLYVHEDFLNNKLKPIEIHLVSIIIYDETKPINKTNQDEIQEQIETIIKYRYKNFDDSKIEIDKNPILNRITYIVFPVWKLKELAEKFQNML